MCRAKDVMRKRKLEKKVKHYKNDLVKLTKTSKLVKPIITITFLKKIDSVF